MWNDKRRNNHSLSRAWFEQCQPRFCEVIQEYCWALSYSSDWVLNMIFRKLFYRGCTKLRQELWFTFSNTELYHRCYGEAVLHLPEWTYSGRNTGRRGLSVRLSRRRISFRKICCRGNTWSYLCRAFQDYRRSRGVTSIMTTTSICQYVKVCSRECRGEHCWLPLKERDPLQKPIAAMRCQWFDH